MAVCYLSVFILGGEFTWKLPCLFILNCARMLILDSAAAPPPTSTLTPSPTVDVINSDVSVSGPAPGEQTCTHRWPYPVPPTLLVNNFQRPGPWWRDIAAASRCRKSSRLQSRNVLRAVLFTCTDRAAGLARCTNTAPPPPTHTLFNSSQRLGRAWILCSGWVGGWRVVVWVGRRNQCDPWVKCQLWAPAMCQAVREL